MCDDGGACLGCYGLVFFEADRALVGAESRSQMERLRAPDEVCGKKGGCYRRKQRCSENEMSGWLHRTFTSRRGRISPE